jgi:ribosome-binding factor A
MTTTKSKPRDHRRGGGAPRFDDGVDPRRFFDPEPDHRAQRKSLQLCAQVRETLNAVLSGTCADPLLQDLYVVDVEPGSSPNQVVVSVAPARPDPDLDPDRILDHLARARGLLRSEIAAAISRRRTPDLLFQVLLAQPAPAREAH